MWILGRLRIYHWIVKLTIKCEKADLEYVESGWMRKEVVERLNWYCHVDERLDLNNDLPLLLLLLLLPVLVPVCHTPTWQKVIVQGHCTHSLHSYWTKSTKNILFFQEATCAAKLLVFLHFDIAMIIDLASSSLEHHLVPFPHTSDTFKYIFTSAMYVAVAYRGTTRKKKRTRRDNNGMWRFLKKRAGQISRSKKVDEKPVATMTYIFDELLHRNLSDCFFCFKQTNDGTGMDRPPFLLLLTPSCSSLTSTYSTTMHSNSPNRII